MCAHVEDPTAICRKSFVHNSASQIAAANTYVLCTSLEIRRCQSHVYVSVSLVNIISAWSSKTMIYPGTLQMFKNPCVYRGSGWNCELLEACSPSKSAPRQTIPDGARVNTRQSCQMGYVMNTTGNILDGVSMCQVHFLIGVELLSPLRGIQILWK